jgi:hypothetical protein
MRTFSIDAKKIDQSLMAKGQYINCAMMENKNGTDQYGNDGFIVQSVTKEQRESGVRGPIIGNWREYSKSKTADHPVPAPAPTSTAEDDEIPF